MAIRVVLPPHLRTLARVDDEVRVDVQGQATQGSVLDALEASYPVLCGTIRDHITKRRRPFVRFFACEEDVSHEAPDVPLPHAVASGAEPFLVVGALAGG
jgi:molybdopterin synthase sulfur carrier subunit